MNLLHRIFSWPSDEYKKTDEYIYGFAPFGMYPSDKLLFFIFVVALIILPLGLGNQSDRAAAERTAHAKKVSVYMAMVDECRRDHAFYECRERLIKFDPDYVPPVQAVDSGFSIADVYATSRIMKGKF